MLDTINKRKPRSALQSVLKNKQHKVKVDDNMKKLFFIYSKGLKHAFDLWTLKIALNA
jgi:hypothetical protein